MYGCACKYAIGVEGAGAAAGVNTASSCTKGTVPASSDPDVRRVRSRHHSA